MTKNIALTLSAALISTALFSASAFAQRAEDPQAPNGGIGVGVPPVKKDSTDGAPTGFDLSAAFDFSRENDRAGLSQFVCEDNVGAFLVGYFPETSEAQIGIIGLSTMFFDKTVPPKGERMYSVTYFDRMVGGSFEEEGQVILFRTKHVLGKRDMKVSLELGKGKKPKTASLRLESAQFNNAKKVDIECIARVKWERQPILPRVNRPTPAQP